MFHCLISVSIFSGCVHTRHLNLPVGATTLHPIKENSNTQVAFSLQKLKLLVPWSPTIGCKNGPHSFSENMNSPYVTSMIYMY